MLLTNAPLILGFAASAIKSLVPPRTTPRHDLPRLMRVRSGRRNHCTLAHRLSGPDVPTRGASAPGCRRQSTASISLTRKLGLRKPDIPAHQIYQVLQSNTFLPIIDSWCGYPVRDLARFETVCALRVRTHTPQLDPHEAGFNLKHRYTVNRLWIDAPISIIGIIIYLRVIGPSAETHLTRG